MRSSSTRRRPPARANQSGSLKVTRAHRRHSLSGLGICGHCGGRLHILTERKKTVRIYCYQRRQVSSCRATLASCCRSSRSRSRLSEDVSPARRVVAEVVSLYESAARTAHGCRPRAARDREPARAHRRALRVGGPDARGVSGRTGSAAGSAHGAAGRHRVVDRTDAGGGVPSRSARRPGQQPRPSNGTTWRGSSSRASKSRMIGSSRSCRSRTSRRSSLTGWSEKTADMETPPRDPGVSTVR